MLHARERCFPSRFFAAANVEPTADLGYALEDADVVVGVMPSRFARPLYREMLPHLKPEMRFVSATKGLEQGTLLRMSEVARQVIGEKFEPRVAVLSGPTFAREVARGEPTAVVIASADQELAASIQREFSGPTFRLYANDDPVGVEMGAALKNIIAIGAGICDGLGLGSNSIGGVDHARPGGDYAAGDRAGRPPENACRGSRAWVTWYSLATATSAATAPSESNSPKGENSPKLSVP